MQHIAVGKWRGKESGPIQVVFGPIGREKVHYEAPGYAWLEKEMAGFIQWFNAKPDTDLVERGILVKDDTGGRSTGYHVHQR